MELIVNYNKQEQTTEFVYKGIKVKTRYLATRSIDDIIKENVINYRLPKFITELEKAQEI